MTDLQTFHKSFLGLSHGFFHWNFVQLSHSIRPSRSLKNPYHFYIIAISIDLQSVDVHFIPQQMAWSYQVIQSICQFEDYADLSILKQSGAIIGEKGPTLQYLSSSLASDKLCRRERISSFSSLTLLSFTLSLVLRRPLASSFRSPDTIVRWILLFDKDDHGIIKSSSPRTNLN